MRHSLLPGLLGFALAVLPLAPVEHVHKAAGSDGHDHVIAHTHTNAHHRSQDHPDHPDASLDDEDSVILTLDMVLAAPYGHVDIAPAATPVRVVDEPGVASRDDDAPLVEPLIHGPPRAPSVLRGPPIASLL